MKGKIAVEPTLSEVKEYLADEGYEVESMNFNDRSKSNLSDYDAVVVSGANTNLFGMQDIQTSTIIINADGLTPPEVARRIDEI